MPEYVATTPGLYPLPDASKDELSDLKGHQKHDLVDGDEAPAVRAAYDDAREAAITAQTDAGLDLIVEGQPRWDDMLAHPLCVHDSVETGGLVRYFDNNNFYRDPVVVDDLGPDGDVASELAAAAELTESLQAVLPGPYTLFDLATDEHYGDDADFLRAVTDFLAGEVSEFPDHESLFLLEPSLVTDPPDEDLHERASGAIDAVAGATDAAVVVHTYWGALTETTHAHLLDADVDAVGYDFVSSPTDNRHLISEYGTKDDVALGLVDGQNTLVESPETIRERLDWFDEETPGMDFETVYVTSNTELFYLPVNRFEEKLDALGTAVTPEVRA